MYHFKRKHIDLILILMSQDDHHIHVKGIQLIHSKSKHIRSLKTIGYSKYVKSF